MADVAPITGPQQPKLASELLAERIWKARVRHGKANRCEPLSFTLTIEDRYLLLSLPMPKLRFCTNYMGAKTQADETVFGIPMKEDREAAHSFMTTSDNQQEPI